MDFDSNSSVTVFNGCRSIAHDHPLGFMSAYLASLCHTAVQMIVTLYFPLSKFSVTYHDCDQTFTPPSGTRLDCAST